MNILEVIDNLKIFFSFSPPFFFCDIIISVGLRYLSEFPSAFYSCTVWVERVWLVPSNLYGYVFIKNKSKIGETTPLPWRLAT